MKDRFECSSSFSIGNQKFGNFESESLGLLSLKRAIELSCDTVFYRIAYDMWQRDGGIKPVPHPPDSNPARASARTN